MLTALRSTFSGRRATMDTLIAVVGATGTGKSKLAVDLACRFNGEIINGDAMQMYRGLPIITNQIPVNERNGIPHHLLSCVDFEAEAWRIGQFKREALRLIDDIRSRGKVPILVGGTHYYTQAVLFKDSLVGEGSEDKEESDIPAESASSSEKWPILDDAPEVMMEKLREVDPVMAARWHPKDGRKIRRSLEIFFQTGRRASEIYAEQQALKKETVQNKEGLLRFSDTVIFWVHAEKEVLNGRPDSRVDTMIEQGLMAEARKMAAYIDEQHAQGVEVDQTRGVWVSIGFKEMVPYFAALQKGDMDETELEKLRKECIELIRIATRQYGVSQVKWIRNKLWQALSEANMTNRLYLLDSSDVSQWQKCVAEPSERLVESILRKEPTPDPKSLSRLAEEVFSAKEQKARATVLDNTCYFCDVCNKTLAGDEQWKIHLAGRAHKRAIKSAAKQANMAEYIRQRKLESQDLKRESAAVTEG
ncbi:hypothetical protein N7470_006993 [Penicillium chermesinum]|nr:hypothetical protein N7470_006993 [Penicillium chermesinum]